MAARTLEIRINIPVSWADRVILLLWIAPDGSLVFEVDRSTKKMLRHLPGIGASEDVHGLTHSWHYVEGW